MQKFWNFQGFYLVDDTKSTWEPDVEIVDVLKNKCVLIVQDFVVLIYGWVGGYLGFRTIWLTYSPLLPIWVDRSFVIHPKEKDV